MRAVARAVRMAPAVLGAVLTAVACGCGRDALPAAPVEAADRAATPYAAKIGVELDGIGDGSRARPFVDLAKTLRGWSRVEGQGPAPVDGDGWPTTDASTVFFDIRPVAAWQGPDHIDDPQKFIPDWSGLYHLSFLGQAVLKLQDASSFTVRSQRYDAKSNTTTAEVVVPKGAGLMVVAFTQTRRTASSPEGSGISKVRLIRPGYPADSRETFTKEFLDSLKPFATLRYMDWTSTNYQPGFYGDAGHHILNWADRRRPEEASQSDTGTTKHGAAWEYVAELANRTGKDLWINIPVSASDDYVRELAALLKKSVNPKLKIYVEHSNEVWNYGFPQYTWNKLAAIDEVGRGGSPLNNDGTKDQEEWARRRHAKRVVEIGKIFTGVFGAGSFGARIRPVYASWTIFPDRHYDGVLKWVEKSYGPPNQLFYGIADAAYFNVGKAPATASVDDLLTAMRASIDENRKFREQIQKIADAYGLKHCQYEGGPDTGGGSTTNVANRIRAQRDPRMKELILHDARDVWFPMGGDQYMYFAHCSPASRYGSWGLSEDIIDRKTPKWQAIFELTGGS